MTVLFANNASSRLYQDTPAGSASIRVQDGDGELFPNPVPPDYFKVTVEDRRTGQMEIMICTSRSGDILAVTRAQEGTVAQDFLRWATVSNRLTAGTIFDYFDYAYSRVDADNRYVNHSGDTMTGALTLAGAPTVPLHAATKAYVDLRFNELPQTTIAAEISLAYLATAGQTDFPLLTVDKYGNTYTLRDDLEEPVEIHVNGSRKALYNGTDFGDYTVDIPTNTITFLNPLALNDVVLIDIFAPKPIPVTGSITMNLLKKFAPDGLETEFEMRKDVDNTLINALKNEEVLVYVNNVPQLPGEDYTASGSILTFTEAPEDDADVWAIWVQTG